MKKEGIFVDVDGTLILFNIKTDKEYLNRELVDKLLIQDKPVTIFSGGHPPVQTERLRLLGCPEQFLPVKSKKEFDDYCLEIIVDDDYCTEDSNGDTQYFSPSEFLLTII